jgi:hypothetical protein
MTRVRSPRILAAMCSAAALAATLVAPAGAEEELIQPKQLDRRFPQFQFCPITLTLDFVAPGTEATIHFRANVYGFDPSTSQLTYIRHEIDGIALSTTADHAANSGFPPSGSNSENCYLDAPAPSFFYNRAGLSLPLLELFDTDPTARGWDMTQGAYFDPTRSCPRDPEHDLDLTGGALGLGLDLPGGSAADSARTSITVTGLTPGTSYTVSGWWYVDENPLDALGNSRASLTVWVTGSGSTPIARRTWGAMKERYRR